MGSASGCPSLPGSGCGFSAVTCVASWGRHRARSTSPRPVARCSPPTAATGPRCSGSVPVARAGSFARPSPTGLDDVYAAQQAGRGVVMVAPHMGNWEVAGCGRRVVEPPRAFGRRGPPEPADHRLVRQDACCIRHRHPHSRPGVNDVDADEGAQTGPGGRSRCRPRRFWARRCRRVLRRDDDDAGRAVLAGRVDRSRVVPGRLLLRRTRVAIRSAPGASDSPMPRSDQNASDSARRRSRTNSRGIIRVKPTDWHLFQPNWPSDATVEEESE